MTWVPEACTLPSAEQPLRVVEFDDLFTMAALRVERVGRTELRIHLSAGHGIASTARELVARETGCCSFFDFDVMVSATSTVLEVRVPDSQAAVRDAMHERALIKGAQRLGFTLDGVCVAGRDARSAGDPS